MANIKLYLQDVIGYLRSEPAFRERKKKDAGIVNLIIARIPALKGLGREVVEAVKMHASMDRCWRKALRDNKELRGSDYGEKAALEDDAQSQLGYSRWTR